MHNENTEKYVVIYERQMKNRIFQKYFLSQVFALNFDELFYIKQENYSSFFNFLFAYLKA